MLPGSGVWSLVLLACTFFATASPSIASTYLDLDDGAYDLLSRLEAEGLITSGLLSTRPISRRDAVRLLREAESRTAGRSSFIAGLVRELRHRLRPDELEKGGMKPLDKAYGRYVHTDAGVQTRSYPNADRELEQSLNANNGGDLYATGSNWRFGFVSLLEDAGPFSLSLNPELRTGGGSERGVLRTGYGVVGFSWIDIIVGKDSQWWGPGQHGAILLSDNAEPLTMVRFTAPTPRTLPWILKYLGPFQYSLFVSRLEADRNDYPRPYFSGIRVSFKPWSCLEVGLAKTSLLGGGDRPDDLKTWVNSLLAINEHEQSDNPGDQRAGFDLKLTIPADVQPVQLYWEQAGEENRQRFTRWPYKLANLYGIYLPRIAGIERLELRAEYALNQVRDQDYVWYTHGTYTSGYTYNGMIMGHHMGTESRDRFASVTLRFPEQQARLTVSVDRMEHDLSQEVRERDDEAVVQGSISVAENLELVLSQGFSRTVNENSVPGATVRARATEVSATLHF